MSTLAKPKSSAFTVRYTGRVLRLTTEVEIFQAHAEGTPIPPSKKFMALYDTGATNTAVSPVVVTALGLATIGAKVVGVGGGNITATSHLVNIALPNRVMFSGVPVAKMVLPGGTDVLIGMDILGVGDFAVTHRNGSTTFSFCCPSQHDVDFAATLQKTTPGGMLIKGGMQASGAFNVPAMGVIPPASRNDRCPCGSGKKYKKCHGQ